MGTDWCWAGVKMGTASSRDRQEPCGQKDSVTAGWQIDLEKGDRRKRKPREQAERRQVDRDKDIQAQSEGQS